MLDICKQCGLKADDPKHICGWCHHLIKDHDNWDWDCTVPNCLAFDGYPCHNIDCRETSVIEKEQKEWEKEANEYTEKIVEDYEAKHKTKWFW